MARQHERVIVTRNGQQAAVLLSPDDLERLEETLAIISDRSMTAYIRESQKALARDEAGIEIEELRASLERRRNKS